MTTQTAYTTLTLPEIMRASLVMDPLADYPVPWTRFRVWDAIQTNLPGTAAADDLALIGGTWTTNSASIQSSNASGTSITQYAWFSFELPPEYVAGQRVYLRARAKVAVAAQVAATIDFVAYESDSEAGISADLVIDAAKSINSTTYANYDFVLTPTNLAAGDVINVRMAISVDDTGGAHASIATVGKVSMLLDVRG